MNDILKIYGKKERKIDYSSYGIVKIKHPNDTLL